MGVSRNKNMKRLSIAFIVFIIAFNISFSQESKSNSCSIKPFKVYLDDEDNYSNIRESPNGEITLKINNLHGYGYVFNVIAFKDGWLKINHVEGVDEYAISNFEGWIHSSIVSVAFTYDVDLLDKPDGKKVLKIKGESGETYKITEVYCEWVKIKTKNGTGWVKSEKLCGNPVTNCS